jgi:enediyne biosynthesis protein E4
VFLFFLFNNGNKLAACIFFTRPTISMKHVLVAMSLVCLIFSCQKKQPESAPTPAPLFREIPAAKSGIGFRNDVAEDTVFNILNYLYFYNGAGVAVGDINGDNLPDLYFSANRLANRLYLNKGNLQFDDITDATGVAGTGSWKTGANFADVNGDGWLDLYLCTVSGLDGTKNQNQLFIHNGLNTNGIPQYKQAAADWGINVSGYSTHSAFFDYDLDGDLDLYVLNHAVHTELSYGKAEPLRHTRNPLSGDRLFRNNIAQGQSNFTEVTEQAGILGSLIGYGLGICVSDLNLDGFPDIYISNDFHENDYLYLNNGNGTFSEKLAEATSHTSRFSMGTDIADVNNDLLPEIFTLDMKPEREHILKTSAPEDAYNIYAFKLAYGYHPQFSRNNLQLHTGIIKNSVPQFSEIGQLADVDATDWSWSALFADLDLDGWKDLFVTNGIFRRPNDMDYLKYLSDGNVKRSLATGINTENLKIVQEMPQVPQPNYAFKNMGNLTFQNQAADWGLAKPGFSNGAAWADLDLDGDYDLIVNNFNEQASIFENQNNAQKTPNHFIRIKLEGEGFNRFGIGAKIFIYTNNLVQTQEQSPARGFQSTVDPTLIFGLGKAEKIDSVIVYWPNNRKNIYINAQIGQTLLAKEKESIPGRSPNIQDVQNQIFTNKKNINPLLKDISSQFGNLPRHQENNFMDFGHQRLLPHSLAHEGPAFAVGDVNKDGLDDFYLGGAAGFAGKLFAQQSDGQWVEKKMAVFSEDAPSEDVDAVFFDADQDGDLDLYVASGGSEFPSTSALLADRLYLNQGKGDFLRSNGLPLFFSPTACVRPHDLDGDGDLDLFVGTRAVPDSYGLSPKSYLLVNDGRGNFKDETASLAPTLEKLGMVTDAQWADVDGDQQAELVAIGEWMPIVIYKRKGSQWLLHTADSVGAKSAEQLHQHAFTGFWNCLSAQDMDGDGDLDLVAGNLGKNAYLKATTKHPISLYVKDFDASGSMDPIITHFRPGYDGLLHEYPLAARDELIEQMSIMRRRFARYRDYSSVAINDLFPAPVFIGAIHKTAKMLTSCYFENDGKGKFTAHELPIEAQMAPVHALALGDFDQDNKPDILLGGNELAIPPSLGRYDAGKGSLLLGDGKGGFSKLHPSQSGVFMMGEVRSIQKIQGQRLHYWGVAQNNGSLLIWQPTAVAQ